MIIPPDITQLFRTEYSKLIAVLCKTYGLGQIEIAEDIVAETFLLATETWNSNEIPESPVGWLYTVAKNKTKDYLKRKVLFEKKVALHLAYEVEKATPEPVLDLSDHNITDGQLQMLFAISHPSMQKEIQIVLALRILCGFNTEQIASALLSNTATINKRLYRGKKLLREQQISLEFPVGKEIGVRTQTVLSTLYLLFNEGYYSKQDTPQLHKDFCLEALRLCLLLSDHKTPTTPQVYALIALMCFHASRFEARYKGGAIFFYKEQDRTLWNKELKEKGEHYLTLASQGEAVSKYHLEAAIAYWHTEEEGSEK